MQKHIADLKSEVERVSSQFSFRINTAFGKDRLTITTKSEEWLKYVELLYHENLLNFTRLHVLVGMKEKETVRLSLEVTSSLWPLYLGVQTVVKKDEAMPSLKKLWPIVDWMEWEINEEFGVGFQGNKRTAPFLKRRVLN